MRRCIVSLVLIFGVVLGYSGLSLEFSTAFASGKHAADSDFISAKDLKALVDAKDPKLILIGVLHNMKAYIPGNLAGKPIDGSFTVWRPDYSGTDSHEAVHTAVGGFRKSKTDMEVLLSKAGATPESFIVVYSADAMHDASRVYWQIKQVGHENVKLLDGGTNAWVDAGYPTGDSERLIHEEVKTQYTAASYDTKAWGVTLAELLVALENPEEWVIIDTRSTGEFEGKKTGSSKGAFGTGGIKGAVHIEWKQALNKDNTVKSKEALQAIYGDVIRGKKVITFCQSGVRSAHTQAILKEVLGADNVYNYDGSWIEWSYAASDVSEGIVDSKVKFDVRSFTSAWADYKKAI